VRSSAVIVLLALACAQGQDDAADARRIPPPVADGDVEAPPSDGDPAADGSAGTVVLNEVDYDQVGTDTDEFVELYNPSDTTVDLSGCALVLVNGYDNQEYGRVPLFGLLPGHAFAVVASTTVAVDDGAAFVVPFEAATNNLQNGAPDAVAIVHLGSGALLDALSYQGPITAGTVTGVGIFDFVEGSPTSAADSDSAARSLIRQPDGHDGGDAATDWAETATPSPGAANVP